MPHSLHFGRLALSSLTRSTNLPSSQMFSVLGWFKYTSDSVADAFAWILAASGNSSYYGFFFDGSDWNVDINGSPNALSTNLTTGRWHHVGIVGSSTAIVLYLDGVSVLSETDVSFTPATMTLGSVNGETGNWINGQWAALKIYDRVLTQAEVVAEIPFALPYNPAGLNSCYPMPTGWDRVAWGIGAKTGSVSPYVDWSGNGDRIWTVGGTVDLDLGPPIG